MELRLVVVLLYEPLDVCLDNRDLYLGRVVVLDLAKLVREKLHAVWGLDFHLPGHLPLSCVP